MRRVKKVLLLLSLLVGSTQTGAFGEDISATLVSMFNLPAGYKTPTGLTLSQDGEVYLAIGNAENQEQGSKLMKITKNEQILELHTFGLVGNRQETLFPGSLDAGNDGHIYTLDIPATEDDNKACRLFRITRVNGQILGCDSVVTRILGGTDHVTYADHLLLAAAGSKKSPGSKIYRFLKQDFRQGFLPDELYTGTNNKSKKPTKGSGLPISKGEPIINIPAESTVSGLAIDPAGNLYISSSNDAKIWKVKLDSSAKIETLSLLTEGKNYSLKSISGLCVDQENNLWITDRESNILAWVNSTTGEIKIIADYEPNDGKQGQLHYPFDCVRRGDKVYVSNYGSGKPGETGTVSVFQIQ